MTGRRITNDADLASLLGRVSNVAIVGVSPRTDRDSNEVARYLQTFAPEYSLSFVNPNTKRVLGSACVDSVADLTQVELVCVFRRLENIPALTTEVVDAGASILWTQLGLYHPAAEHAATAAGLDVVMDRCIKVEYARLIGSAGSG